MKRLLIALLFLGFTNSANATDLYKVDPSHASINWTANHFGFSNQSGKITDVTGTVNLDEANPQLSAIDVQIGVGSLVTGLGPFDTHLKSADFLNVAKFPTATFKSTSVAPSGKTFAKVKGNLTLLGVTKAITLDVKLIKIGISPVSQKKTIGFNATTTLKRSDFGMTFGAPGVADNVKIVIDLEANFISSDIVIPEGAAPILSDRYPSKFAKAVPEWKIVSEKSKLEFKAIRDNSDIRGSFKTFDGKISFDPDQLSKSKISIDVDTSSVDISYAEALSTLRGAAWLSTKISPKATFVSERIVLKSDVNLNNIPQVNLTDANNVNINTMNNVKLDAKSDINLRKLPKPDTFIANGKLTIKGKTVPASLEFVTTNYTQTQATATGKLKIKRSTFGIGDRDTRKASGVQDDIEITFTINAER